MNDAALKILLVEDSESDADLLIRFLKKEKINFSHSRVWDKNGFTTALKEQQHDLIISDQALPQFSGMEAFRISRNEQLNIPFILVTGTVSETLLSEYAKEGIDDYILKENLLRLPSAIKHILGTKKIELLNRKLEVAHKAITDSLNYAKLIQEAKLPKREDIFSALPESFVLFKPKDIVSGDFYFFHKNQESIFIASVDCTGHGVPGALVSMIGSEILNEAVLLSNDTAHILKYLNKGIKNSLRQNGNYETSKDGMDISLVRILLSDENVSAEQNKIQFAGANRPLWVFRNAAKSFEEYKPTKRAIGGFTDYDQEFMTHDINLEKGDSFYIFSDGYADTFGGPLGKKLMTKRFRQILMELQAVSMEEQGLYLDNFIERWKGREEQVDDILVIGVKIS